MKVAFVIEYFLPFSAGGAEWSTFYIAKLLKEKNVKVVILTPNFGAPKEEILDGIKILRYPFYKRLTSTSTFPGNFAFTNPLWIFWSTLFLFFKLRKENPDIIHVQGKYSVPPAMLANIFLKKPVVATVRDYILVCNYGLCLFQRNKACNLKEYFFKDFRKYYQNYVENKKLTTLFLNLLYAVWGRFSRNFLKFFINRVDLIIAISHKVGSILKANGIVRPIKVIYNPYIFTNPNSRKKENFILFVGRLTYGKGLPILLEAYKKVRRKYPKTRLVIIGSGPLSQKVKEAAKVDKKISYLGNLEHSKVFAYYQKAKLVVVPSYWPDPLPRVGLEALSFATPVVFTKNTGLVEVIREGVFGYGSENDAKSLAKTIIKSLNRNSFLQKNIIQNYSELKNFNQKLVSEHLDIYRKLVR